MNKYITREKININNIFFEDNFIDLINKLSKIIQEHYHLSLDLISKSAYLIPIFQNNINQISSIIENNNNNLFNESKELEINIINLNSIKNDYELIKKKTEENLKNFIQNSKNIFKEMKNIKNNKLDEIYNNYACQKNNLNTIDQMQRIKSINFTTSNSKNQKSIRNKTSTRINNNNKNSLFNLPFLKSLIYKMNEYNDIISNYSYEAMENYSKLQKQILFEINKSVNSSMSKSVDKNKNMKIPINMNDGEKKPCIIIKTNSNELTMTSTNNNSYFNIIDNDGFNIGELKDFNNNTFNNSNKSKDLIDEIKDLKLKLEDSKSLNKTLESTLRESENFKKSEKMKFNKYKIETEIKMKFLEKENNELKNEYNHLLRKRQSEENEEETTTNPLSAERNFEHNLKIENEMKKLREEMDKKKNEYELNIKKLNEEINEDKKENEKKLKILNDENTSLSKYLADKNREIQILQNSNKLKQNEINKLKLIIKNNEKQLKVKQNKENKKNVYNPNSIKIKDLLSNPNKCDIDGVNNLYNKEIVGKLEMEITKLKEEIEELNEEKDNLALNINVLESNISDKTNENMLLEKDIEEKDYKIKDDLRLINELKTEKDKLMLKLKEYKDIEELNLSQIKILKEHIKTLEKQQNDIIDPNTNKRHIKKKELKKKINELEIEKISLKTQLEKELNYNIQLKKEVNIKTEQIDILNKKINKLKGEEEDNIYTLNNKTKTIDNNSNFIRSKTNEEYKKINIKKIISKSPNKIKRRNNNILNKEYKTDKRLDLYKINETDLNSLPKDDLKTEN